MKGVITTREILFRGKDVNSNEWRYGYYAHFEDMHGEKADLIYTGYADVHMGSLLTDSHDVKPETVGQYTGIKGKSEKKIFEHDIVKAYDPLDEISFIGVVKYFDGSFYICDTDFCSYYRWIYYEVEVIGNIHDNPELLK